jgi:hypothetical protein
MFFSTILLFICFYGLHLLSYAFDNSEAQELIVDRSNGIQIVSSGTFEKK